MTALAVSAFGAEAPGAPPAAQPAGTTPATAVAPSADTTVVRRLDLDHDAARQTVVDKEEGVYLGHVSTVRLDDGVTILAAYPKGHGRGPIVLKRSEDGGRTWSARLPVPDSWATSRETPTLFRMGTTERGESLILFSGLYPIRAARSADGGRSWTELSPIGDFGGIVAMGGLAEVGDGTFAAFFHDDGRFFGARGKSGGTFTLYQTDTPDRGSTWSPPRRSGAGRTFTCASRASLPHPMARRSACSSVRTGG